MNVQIRILGPTDLDVLQHVDPGVFDHPVRTDCAMEFLQDSRHHIAVAVGETGNVIGMASAFHYVHPDKPAQLFINEVGVAESYRRRGIGRQLVNKLIEHARQLGCYECWVATEAENAAARALFVNTGGTQALESIVMYTYRVDRPNHDTINPGANP